jgi:hypothetical protein
MFLNNQTAWNFTIKIAYLTALVRARYLYIQFLLRDLGSEHTFILKRLCDGSVPIHFSSFIRYSRLYENIRNVFYYKEKRILEQKTSRTYLVLFENK